MLTKCQFTVLHDQVDFDAFIETTLVAEAGKQKPGYNIIRRRIAIIIAQWIAIRVAKEKKPIVYQIFQHLMDSSDPLNDQVVRVTAGRKFKDIADEWEFNAENFLPYAPGESVPQYLRDDRKYLLIIRKKTTCCIDTSLCLSYMLVPIWAPSAVHY